MAEKVFRLQRMCMYRDEIGDHNIQGYYKNNNNNSIIVIIFCCCLFCGFLFLLLLSLLYHTFVSFDFQFYSIIIMNHFYLY